MMRRGAAGAEAADDRRIRDYVVAPGGISESAASLADKLGISRRTCRRVLEDLAKHGVVRRHEFTSIAPMYCRFPTLSRPTDAEVVTTIGAEWQPNALPAASVDMPQAQVAPSPAR